MDPTVRAFVEAINRHDVPALAALITDDHRFIDSLGTELGGANARATMIGAWQVYLEIVPDYHVEIEFDVQSGDTVVLLGHAGGTLQRKGELSPENAWRVPAAWRVRLRGGKVALWQVYADNKRMHEMMSGR